MVQYLLKTDKLKFKQPMGKAQHKESSANSGGSQQRRPFTAEVKIVKKWFSLEGAGQQQECCAAAKTN